MIHKPVKVSYDPAKRAKTLEERGLDFDDSVIVFSGRTATRADYRRDYGEDRFITVGRLAERCVVLVWTPRDDGRRIISMRHGHDGEEAKWGAYLD